MFKNGIFFISCVILLCISSINNAESTNQQQYYQPTASEVIQFMQHNTQMLQKMQKQHEIKSGKNNHIELESSKSKSDNKQMHSAGDQEMEGSMPSGTIEQLANDPDLIRQIANRNYGIPIEGRNLVSSNLPSPDNSIDSPQSLSPSTDLSPHSKSEIGKIFIFLLSPLKVFFISFVF